MGNISLQNQYPSNIFKLHLAKINKSESAPMKIMRTKKSFWQILSSQEGEKFGCILLVPDVVYSWRWLHTSTHDVRIQKIIVYSVIIILHLMTDFVYFELFEKH